MADERTQYHGIFLPESDGAPIALFKFADQAQQVRKTFYGNNGAVAPIELDVPRHDEMADLLAAGASAAPDATPSGGEEQLRAEIRAELVRERTRERLRREIAAELDAEDREGGRAVELREPAVGGARSEGGEVVPLTEAGDLTVTAAQRDALLAAGFKTAEDIRAATDEQLLAVPGIGPKTVADLREATRA
jgi:hypothetical protein